MRITRLSHSTQNWKKSITKEAVVQNQTITNQEKQTVTNREKQSTQKKLQKRKFKIPYARKHEDARIPSEKVTLSSAEMANTLEQKNTFLEKSDGVSNEEKLSAANIIPINILNRPSPIKEYRYNILERSSRPSRNRVRDSKGKAITFYSNFFARRAHDLYSNITYNYGLFFQSWNK